MAPVSRAAAVEIMVRVDWNMAGTYAAPVKTTTTADAEASTTAGVGAVCTAIHLSARK